MNSFWGAFLGGITGYLVLGLIIACLLLFIAHRDDLSR